MTKLRKKGNRHLNILSKAFTKYEFNNVIWFWKNSIQSIKLCDFLSSINFVATTVLKFKIVSKY